jgi:serine/threonine protein kinase
MHKYIYGSTGFVELYHDSAYKYVPLNSTYWLRELSIYTHLERLDHPNIIKPERYKVTARTDPKTKKKRKFFEFKFMRYPKSLDKPGILNDQDVLQLYLDILSAISACHRIGIWHRDLKLSNILNNNGRAVLIDFSHALNSNTGIYHLDDCVTTYTHRAPEIFHYSNGNADYYTEKVDVWSMGIILYELVMGRPIEQLLDIRSEKEMETLIMDSNFKEILQRKYFATTDAFIEYKQRYWKWIDAMLNNNCECRPSIDYVVCWVLDFCNQNKIKYIYNDNIKLRSVGTYDIPENPEIDQVLYRLRFYHKKIPIRDIDIVWKIINVLGCDCVDHDELIITVLILIETIVFDNISKITTFVDFFNKKMHIKVNYRSILNLLLDIIQIYGDKLFLNAYNIY